MGPNFTPAEDMARSNTQSPSGGADFFGVRERDRETGQNANTYNANGLTMLGLSRGVLR